MTVNSHTEWGQLKEVILGSATNAQIPVTKNHDIHCVDYANYNCVSKLPGGNYPLQIIEETNEDLEEFSNVLAKLGVKVHRPDPVDFSIENISPHWSSDGYYNYCPRDSAIIIGDLILEAPMVLRARYFEIFSLRKIFQNYFLQGSRWISAPKPQLLDELYDRSDLTRPTLTNFEPAFDAANIIRCGADLFYLVSNSGNKLGAKWLNSILGSKYTIHQIDNIYAYVHLDTTIMPLAPGIVLLNPARVDDNNLPKYFHKWKKIYAAEPNTVSCLKDYAPASPWLSMNLLSVNESTVIVEKRQKNLIKQLEHEKFTVIPISLRHARTLSGGPHCVTLDTVRLDSLDKF